MIKIVVLPYAFPISLATVSESLVAKLATKPVLRVVHSAPSPWNARAARAQAAAANPDPHTLAGVLLPSFLSYVPSAIFTFLPTFVASVPNTK